MTEAIRLRAVIDADLSIYHERELGYWIGRENKGRGIATAARRIRRMDMSSSWSARDPAPWSSASYSSQI